MSDNIHYEKLIYENQDKFYRLYVTVSEFKDKYYVNIRKYFQSYEGDFVPSREGVSMEASIGNVQAVIEAFLEIASNEEGKELLTQLYKQHVETNHS